MGEMINAYRILVSSLKGSDCLKGNGVHWKIILKSNLKEQYMIVWIGFIWLRIVCPVAVSCEHGNAH
jgi:hypothetical protein